MAVAASQDSSRSSESKAIIDDAAKQLGIPSSKLSDALKAALKNRVDAAVAAGRITKAEGDAIKERIAGESFPLLGGLHRGFGHHVFFGRLDAAAGYLGLTGLSSGPSSKAARALRRLRRTTTSRSTVSSML